MSHTRHVVQAAAALTLLGGALLVPSGAHAATTPPGDAQISTSTGDLRLVAGTIRQDLPGSGWYLVNAGTHTPHNLAVGAVTSAAVTLEVPITGHIVSVVCSPDETYAQLGYTCGVSANLDNIVVKIGRNGVPVDPTTLSAGPYANFWILGFVEA